MSRDLVSEEELTCPHCHLVGCDCDKPHIVIPKTAAGVCQVCHRSIAACICKSRVEMISRIPATKSGDHVPAHNIEGWVNEALFLYRERDEVGLQRFLRGVFKSMV
jgi:hypothetical protein